MLLKICLNPCHSKLCGYYQAKNISRSGAQFTIKHDGDYLLIIHMESSDWYPDSYESFDATITISMEGNHGYLSVVDWPLLPFYGCMSGIYLTMAIIYGVFIPINNITPRIDSSQINLWIFVIIIMGLLENALFYAEFGIIYYTGIPNYFFIYWPEILSCLKRTLAR